jgi:PilZ domain
MKEERRLHVRRNFFTQGCLVYPNASVECLLHNISAGGALASVERAAELPKAFILQIPGNHEIRRRCLLAWRDGKWVGMKFVERKKLPRMWAAAG